MSKAVYYQRQKTFGLKLFQNLEDAGYQLDAW